MTETPDNLPARIEPTPALLDTDSWREMAAPILRLAETVNDTEFVPRGLRGSMPKTAAAMLYGREVGLPPMTSLAMLDVIEGKPGLTAEGMRALVLAAGHEIEVLEKTGAMVAIRGRRRGSERWHTVAWTIDMARAAGLAGKGVWQKYPRAMLLARASTELCRDIFPDVIHGFRSLEELEDMGDMDESAPVEPRTPPTRVARKRAATSAKPNAAALEGPRPVDDTPMGPPLPHEISEGPGGPSVPDASGGASTDTGEGGAVGATGAPSPASTDAGSGEGVPVAPPLPVRPICGDESPLGTACQHEPGHDGPHADGDGTWDDPQTPDGGGNPDLGEGDGAPPPSGPQPSGRKRSASQHRMIMGELTRVGVDVSDRPEKLLIVGTLLGRPLDTTNNITHAEAMGLIDTLSHMKDRAALDAHLDSLTEEREGDTLI